MERALKARDFRRRKRKPGHGWEKRKVEGQPFSIFSNDVFKIQIEKTTLNCKQTSHKMLYGSLTLSVSDWMTACNIFQPGLGRIYVYLPNRDHCQLAICRSGNRKVIDLCIHGHKLSTFDVTRDVDISNLLSQKWHVDDNALFCQWRFRNFTAWELFFTGWFDNIAMKISI